MTLGKSRKNKKMRKRNYFPKTIEELLHGRSKNPIATLRLIKDIARRIKKLEKKCSKI